ncbi:hypothetical protein NEOKW01_1512 [Nematocida sp. AWRm80]|nr:hypothetical protein NEOKW01_1512 [Nematocida sp. AWRm80]
MRYKIYIYIVITVLYIQLYKQSNRADEVEEIEETYRQEINCSMKTIIDKCIERCMIDRTNSHIQLNQPVQLVEQRDTDSSYYSANPTYDNNISRKRDRTEQNTSTIDNLDTTNSMNIGLDISVPYSAKRAKKSDTNMAIAGTSAGNDTNNLMNTEDIKKYIHIEEDYTIIDMHIFYERSALGILREEIKKYKGNTAFIQYNPTSISQKHTAEAISAMNMLLDIFSVIVIWKSIDNTDSFKSIQMPKALLEYLNARYIEIQESTKITDSHITTKDTNRIVLCNLPDKFIYNMANLICNRNIINCHFSNYNPESCNHMGVLNEIQKIYVLDILTSSKHTDYSLLSFLSSSSSTSTDKKDPAIDANANVSIDSNNSANTHIYTDKDKEPSQSIITYLSLIDRIQSIKGINNLGYMIEEARERIDLSYLLWTQLIIENNLLSFISHTLVIYTTICNKKKAVKKAHLAIQRLCNNISGVSIKNKKTENTKNENDDTTTNTSSQSNTNVSEAERIKWIITAYKTYAYTMFPNLKTLIIYTYESDRMAIEADIEEWFKLYEQEDEISQIEEQKDIEALIQEKQDNDQKPLQKIETLEKIQIYFVPDSVRSNSPDFLTLAYIYDDKNRPNLDCLCYYRDKNGVFTTSPPEEIA